MTTVTVTIPYNGQVSPPGANTVSDSQGNTVTVPATAYTAANNVLTRTANLPTSGVAVGTDTLTVSQAGHANYTGSTGSGWASITKAAAGANSATRTNTYGAATTPMAVTIRTQAPRCPQVQSA